MQKTLTFCGLISDCTIRNYKRDSNFLYGDLAVPNVYQSVVGLRYGHSVCF